MIYASGFEMFREVARRGSFTRAASALGVSGASVSRQVKSLEQKLGLVLFHRTTRTVALTEAGRHLADTLNRGDDEVSNLLDLLAQGQERPSGRLKLNAPMAFGERFLVGPIAEYAQLYPEVIVDVEFNDKRVHLVEEGYDLVIRIGALEDSGLVARRLCDFPAAVFASPAFLDAHGVPVTPVDLRHLPSVHYINAATGLTLSYRAPDGGEASVTLTPAIYTNSVAMLVESTVRGIGFARLPLFAIQHLIDSGAVRQVLPDFTFLPERGIYAIYPDKRFLPLKVRKFIDLLRARLDDSTGAAGA